MTLGSKFGKMNHFLHLMIMAWLLSRASVKNVLTEWLNLEHYFLC